MLRCSGVQFARDGFELGPIDAVAKSGTITAVVGPNASGKTTLLEVVAGVRKPLQGMVQVDALNMHTCSSDHRAAVMAMMPQRPPVECPLSVGRLVSLGRLRLGRESVASEQAMEALGLESLRDREVCSLSVGQAQRAHLARAFAQAGPSTVLVLDEPTAPLDHRWATRTWDLLRGHAQAGGAVLVAIHDLAVAADRADDVWLLQEGKLLAAGSSPSVCEPGLLRRAFGTSFEWTERKDGSKWLVPAGADQ